MPPRLLRPAAPWMDEAACKGLDPDLFFPTPHVNASNAKRICAACPVRIACLDYACRHGEAHGIWGGLAEKERRRYRRQIGAVG